MYILRWIRFNKYWKLEVAVILLGFLSIPLGLANPYLAKLIIDKAYGNKDLRLFIILIAVGGVIFILNHIAAMSANYLKRYIKNRINFDLNYKVFKKLQCLPYSFFQDTSTGKNLFNITYDIELAAQFISDVLPEGIYLIPKSLFIFFVIFYLNQKMALFALALTPFLYLVPLYFTRKLKKALTKWIENSEDIFEKIQEVLSHIQLIKAFGKEKNEVRHYVKGLIKNIRISLANTKLQMASSFGNNLINRIISGLIIFYGGYQIIKGKMTLGSLSAISIYLIQLSGLQSSLAAFFQQISMGLVSCERLKKIFEAQPEFEEGGQIQKRRFSKGHIELRNITFGYKRDRIILNNLSFAIKEGSCIGLVGPSGCGKSTIINLILRLYKPLSGAILIDGYNIFTLQTKAFYEQIGVVLQEPYLWNDTIENNIRYGKEDATFNEVREAARLACIDDFINGVSQKYNTVIGENACKISEGQKQRIAIARAIIKRPQILILDEALSSVDAEVEARIINNIRDFLKCSTKIIISHRLSAIRNMDLIYFLVGPDKIDIGTHERLLKDNINYQNYLTFYLWGDVLLSKAF